MRKLGAAFLIFLGLASAALAQTVNGPNPNAGVYGAYNSSPPTCTNARGCWFQTDANGNLKVTGAGSGTTLVNPATPANWGIGATSAAVPANAVYLGINTGGTLVGWTGAITNTSFGATQATAANLNATVVGTGTFATQATLAAETTKVIGTVNQGTSPWVISGAVTNAGTFAVQSQPTPVTSGGLSVYNVQPAASDNHIVIKAGAGQVYKIEAFNNSATVNYIRLYNATTGFNGCNSATNIVWQGIIPASTSGAGLATSWESGMAFATGISICVTSGYAQNDTTNATASALVVNVGYK